LSNLDKKKFKLLEELTDVSSNRKNYRNYIENLNNNNDPIIPFLGTNLSDLVFLDTGNIDYKMINDIKSYNITKRCKMVNIINQIIKYQNKDFELKEIRILQQYFFCQFNSNLISEEENFYSISKKLE
jgi:hypothetical protein